MVFEKVRAILARQLNIEESAIAMESSIRKDLGADSLDAVDLLMYMEDEFLIDIPDDEIGNTVGDIVSFIERETESAGERKSA